MSARDDFPAGKALFALLTVLLLAGAARAYVGPEAGPEFLGYFAGLLLWMGAALSGLLLWPVYAVLRRLRGRGARPAAAPGPAVAAPECPRPEEAVCLAAPPVAAPAAPRPEEHAGP
jgi:hypothetical protein